jgi:oxygen-independent coproporphyrinogen-3 oxidase
MYREYKNSPILPDDDEQADMYSYAAEMLERYGYKQYEISNFSAPGFESRHNLKYWNMDDYISFGPGSHSCVGNVRYSYIKDLKEYIAGVHRKISIVDEYEEISPLERAVEYVMLGMRTSRGISKYDYVTRTQCDWRPIGRVLEAFKEKGWVTRTEDRWHFTVPGFLISNTLISIMLETQASGHIEGAPWISGAEYAAGRVELPKGEEELFAELYENRKRQRDEH